MRPGSVCCSSMIQMLKHLDIRVGGFTSKEK